MKSLELAFKGMERVEKRSVSKEKEERLGFDPDFSISCVPYASGDPDCASVGSYCAGLHDCEGANPTCACTCPDPPPSEPNAHYVSDDCSSVQYCPCNIFFNQCMAGSCKCGGDCYYDCTAPYVWDGSDCVLPKKGLHFGDGLVTIQT